ncbi:hypothetical protein [Gymnodinialimonas hymeniacidonis]|uniref:hypothetical protein n=1 Tax=Gymnodinialimonas hymeniacidonis TaxID=3126508 RepID=UPI0034C622A5
MRLAVMLFLWAAPAAAFEACVSDAMDAFEGRLTAALNEQAAPNFDLVRGRFVADCGGIALLQCGGDAACREAATDLMLARAERFAEVPMPEAVSGRNPPWSDGLYPQLWATVDSGCGACGPDAALEHLGEAAALWQVARVVGVVEAGSWR